MQAIILKSENVNEYDRKLTVFSYEQGKLSLSAKGARKPKAKLAGHLGLFNLCELEIAGKTIIGVRIIDDFKDLRDNLDKLENAFFIADIVDRFVFDNFKDLGLFNLIKSWPGKQNFEKEFLKIMGFAGARYKNIKDFLNEQI